MPDRLRDLIVKQRSSTVEKTSLALFAERLSGVQFAATGLASDPEAEVQKTRAQILANASQAMLAQATQTRSSVLALLQV